MSGSADDARPSPPEPGRVHNHHTHTKGTIMDNARTTTSAGGYEVPVDPMDDLQCDSCQ